MLKYIVKNNVKEQSAKDYLKRHENISSSLWKKIKKQDEFFLNGQKIRPTRAIVKPGDIIEYRIVEQSNVLPVNLPLTICYEDDYLLIADKPAGILTHPLTFEAEKYISKCCDVSLSTDKSTNRLSPVISLRPQYFRIGSSLLKLDRYNICSAIIINY